MQGHVIAREEARKVLQEAYARAAIDHKIKLNTLTPIAAIPTELLTYIFLQYVASELTDADPETRIPSHPYSFLKITHVCHHWREAALKSPMLWQNVTYLDSKTSRECVHTVLARSMSCPLNIYIEGRADHESLEMPDVVEVIFQAVSRARILCLSSVPQSTLASLVPRAPDLTILCLARTGRVDWLPDSFDYCEFPSLQELVLDRYKVTGDNPIFKSPGLLEFSHSTSDDMECVGDASLSALKRTPQLKHLRLTGVFGPIRGPHVKLPDLEYLYWEGVSSNPKFTFGWLDMLTLPATHSACIDVSRDVYSPEYCFSDFTSLIDTFTTRRGEPIRSVAVWGYATDTHSLRAVNVDLYYAMTDTDSMGSLDLAPPHLRIMLSLSSQEQQTFIDEVLASLPLTHVRSLLIFGIPYNTQTLKPAYVKLLQKMPELHTLHLGDVSCKDLPVFLNTRIGLIAPKTPRHLRPWLIPHLRKLVIEHVKWKPAFKESLMKALNGRDAAGIGLEHVMFLCCSGLNQDAVVEMDDVSETQVNWDGKQKSCIEKWTGPLASSL
ncbi:hypothetical protein EUX98_g6489 [Antrodiella citrinella]|uniref:Uncharacterized protein n=1 Tax=Antrodiella citrinella TaxID=2447956 RepID=A0A4S4MP58_9APHY|nr:hypothetical protein EUX98_g6489 [Antrodiella citrinella]